MSTGAARFTNFDGEPESGSTDVAIRPTLTFYCDDELGGPRSNYDESSTDIRFKIDGDVVFSVTAIGALWDSGTGYETSAGPNPSNNLNYDLAEEQQLEPSTSYTFSVEIAEHGGAYTEVLSKTFTTGAAQLPQKASGPNPVNGTEIDIVSDYKLSWSVGGGTDSVNVYIGSSPGSLSQIASGVTTSFYVVDEGDFPDDSIVYWRIDTVNDEGTTTGDEWYFDPRVLTATNPTPSDTATGVSLTQSRLYWDGGQNYQTFDVYINGGLVKADTTNEYFDLDEWASWPLTASTAYTWHVDSKNEHSSQDSATWSFTTGAAATAGDTRPESYDPDAVWDTETESWVTDNSVITTGGGRHQSQIIVIGHNVIYFGSI